MISTKKHILVAAERKIGSEKAVMKENGSKREIKEEVKDKKDG